MHRARRVELSTMLSESSNKRVSPAVACLLAACLAACSPTSPSPPAQQSSADAQPQGHYFVSYYELLGQPEAFAGKRVQVQGVLSSQDNVAVLYPTSESLRHAVVVDSIILKFTPEQWERWGPLNGRFVALEGTFQPIRSLERVEAGIMDPVTRVIDLTALSEVRESAASAER